MKILVRPDIESFIQFTNDINQNHWILVEWDVDPELGVLPSVCAATADHLLVFQNWLISNEEFMWTNEGNDTTILKTGAEVLQELTLYYDDNMIVLYQKLHELSQKYKSQPGTRYTFNNFIEDVSMDCVQEDRSAPTDDLLQNYQQEFDDSLAPDETSSSSSTTKEHAHEQSNDGFGYLEDEIVYADQNPRAESSHDPEDLEDPKDTEQADMGDIDISRLSLKDPSIHNVLQCLYHVLHGSAQQPSGVECNDKVNLDIPEESANDLDDLNDLNDFNEFNDYMSGVDFSNIKPFVISQSLKQAKKEQ